MDWMGWAVFGLGATLALTAMMVVAQLTGLTRMGIPMVLGTMFVEDPDKARALGVALHVVAGYLFALVYVAAFAALDLATWWLGALFGAFHGIVALALILPLTPGFHPRMASERTGDIASILEPPGVLGMNYGVQTPVVGMIAHIVYGTILGIFITAG
jgi:hypothetical protein